jgi:hypothetical protein
MHRGNIVGAKTQLSQHFIRSSPWSMWLAKLARNLSASDGLSARISRSSVVVFGGTRVSSRRSNLIHSDSPSFGRPARARGCRARPGPILQVLRGTSATARALSARACTAAQREAQPGHGQCRAAVAPSPDWPVAVPPITVWRLRGPAPARARSASRPRCPSDSCASKCQRPAGDAQSPTCCGHCSRPRFPGGKGCRPHAVHHPWRAT